MDVLENLRSSDFNNATTAALESHPFFQAAEGGTLTKAQLRSFVQEQYFIQQADLLSLTHLASRGKAEGKTACEKMFEMLAGGEKIAQGMLLDMAKWLGLSTEDLDSYQCQIMAQAYPSYLARCAHHGTPAMVAAACAVNFPCWGAQCGRLHEALLAGKCGPCGEEDVAFLKFFATPIDGFDGMAAACIEEEGSSEESVREAVRLLQACEVMFWDSVFKAAASN